MHNKTLISLAVASSIALTGCLDDGSSGANANPDYKIDSEQFSGKSWPRFEPIAGDLPIPSDLNFRSDNAATEVNEADGSFQVLTNDPNPVTEALNQLSGASTVAPPVVTFNGRIDESTVDSRAFLLTGDATNPVIPNPNQNVFLIELDYASGDPVRALSIGEKPTIPVAVTAQMAAGGDLASGGALVELAQNPAYEAEVVTLSGDSAIRINPTSPLKPFTRYLVVVTKEVLDVNGDPIVSSPTYSNLTLDAAGAPIISSNLAAVRRLINSFWEPTATAYFGVNNAARGSDPLAASDIALSYSFTTSNDERVLAYIARPATYFEETLRGALRVGAAQQVIAANPQAGYADIKPVADAVVTDAGFQTTDIFTALKNAQIFAAAGLKNCLTESVECAGVGLEVANSNPANPATPEAPPTPKDRSSTAEFGQPQDVTLVSAVTSQVGIGFGEVNLVQGTIELPYYLGIPSASDGSVINTQSWEADAEFAQQIGAQLGVNFGQAVPSNSKVVNYRYPFPREVAKVRVPIMIFYPATADLSGTNTIPVTMYMHGITTDRSSALTFGSNLAKSSGSAVVVIDQPLHGIAPFSAEEQRELAETLLASGQEAGLPPTLAPNEGTIDALIAGELAYNATVGFLNGAGTIDASNGVDDDEKAIVEGTIGAALTTGTGDGDLDAAIRALTSFQNTVANAGSTVPGIAPTEYERHFGFTASAQNTPVPMNFDKDAAFGDSGSLFINLTNFTNSRDKNRQAVVDLLNVRASLAGLDFAGGAGADLDATNVSYTGHSLGAIVGTPFVAVTNEVAIANAEAGSIPDAAAESIESTNLLTPGGGIVRLLENSPTFAPRILGGLAAAAGLQQGDAALETFFNVNQAAIDAADPINFANNLVLSGSKVLLSQVNGDQVIPNEAQVDPLGQAFKAYLSGSEPLAAELGAIPVTSDTVPVLIDEDAAITRYVAGTHGTPVLPRGGALDSRVFAEMVKQNIALTTTGAVIIFDDQPSEIIQQD